jgi:hypothetical protein
MTSTPPVPIRTHRSPTQATESAGSLPIPLHNYDCLPENAYQLNLCTTRQLVARLTVTVHVMSRQISEMSILHEEVEQEAQMKMYWYKNMLKDYKEQNSGKFHEARSDATYYLHKYLQKKKLE